MYEGTKAVVIVMEESIMLSIGGHILKYPKPGTKKDFRSNKVVTPELKRTLLIPKPTVQN